MSELEDIRRFMKSKAFQRLSESARKEMLEDEKRLRVEELKETLQQYVMPLLAEWHEPVHFNLSYNEKEGINIDFFIPLSPDSSTLAASTESTVPAPQIEAQKSLSAFSVTFDDGQTICGKDSLETFVQTLQKVGLINIPDLNITFGPVNLVSALEKDASKQTLVDGTYIYTDLDAEGMIKTLQKVSDYMYLDLVIDKRDVHDAIVAEPKTWVEYVTQEYPEYSGMIMSKEIDWSVLNYGFTVPQSFHLAIQYAYVNEIPKGGSVNIKIIWNHEEHDANILFDRNGVMQVRWAKKSSLLAALRKQYADTYAFMVESKQNAEKKKAQVQLPDSLKHLLQFCHTKKNDVFLLIPYDNTNIFSVINRPASTVSKNSVHHGSPHTPQQNGKLQVCNIGDEYHTKRVNHFVLEVFKRLNAKGVLNDLAPFLTQIADHPNRCLKKSGVFDLGNILIATTKEDIDKRNEDTIRWFSEPFQIDGNTMYLSTQWRNDGGKGLQFSVFKKMLSMVYPGMFEINEKGKDLYLKVL